MLGLRVSYEGATQPGLCSPYNFGVNAIFFALIPYTVVTALHDTHLEVALILGTAISGAIILFGIIVRFSDGYRTWPYALELFMLVVNAVLLGVSYLEPEKIKKYLPFISNAFYATFALISIMMTIPFTIQYVREFVPSSAATYDRLVRAAYATASLWTLTFVTNTLLYLVPICRNRDQEHSHALNLVFRIILPIFLALFAALFTRLWPVQVMQQLAGSSGFDGAFRKVVINPLAVMGDIMDLPLPPPPGGPYAMGAQLQQLQVQAIGT
ncbi:hypothetical protein VaNZ11_003922 [Volvox africanus]|uniref:Uncharacterized protein n=1 Tax=Volvox africanus TaxID=51714 RepID=A0ABQ5RV82_9CHLO|nr:hypothetical protein VaNZ11_003922 [Volvox africanus]